MGTLEGVVMAVPLVWFVVCRLGMRLMQMKPKRTVGFLFRERTLRLSSSKSMERQTQTGNEMKFKSLMHPLSLMYLQSSFHDATAKGPFC